MKGYLKFIITLLEFVGVLTAIMLFQYLLDLITGEEFVSNKEINYTTVLIVLIISFICFFVTYNIRLKNQINLILSKPAKIFLIIFFLILLFGKFITIIFDRETINKSNIEKHIEEIQKELPKNISSKCIFTSIKLEENNIVFSYYYNIGAFNKKWRVENPEKAKRLCATGILSLNENIIEELIKNKIGIKIIANSFNQEKWECNISPDYIENLIYLHRSDSEKFYKHNLEITINQSLEEIPIEIEEGLKIIDIKYEEEYVVYTIKVDEDIYSMEEINSCKKEIKEEIKRSFMENEESYLLLSLCCSSNSGIKYKYLGDKSLELIEITLFNFELSNKLYNINKKTM